MSNLKKVEAQLKSLNINYELMPVDPQHLDIDSTVKHLGILFREGMSTLVYQVRGNSYAAVLRRDDMNFDIKRLKLALGSSRVSFSSAEGLKELGFETGLVSPVLLGETKYNFDGQETNIKVYIDKTITEMDWVYCGSTSPEFALKISKDDLLKTLGDYETIDISVLNPSRVDSGSEGGDSLGSEPDPATKSSKTTTEHKVIVDKVLIAKFLNRGVEKILPQAEQLRKLLVRGERITAYMGFDPTGPYLHVGHAMGIRALRILQQLGHRVIFLVGDYTARVGDPDKGATRKLLSTEDIAQNMAGWKKQAGQLIDFNDPLNPVEFKGNYTWLHKLTLEDLIKLMSKMTVQQILERDLFQKRLQDNKPLQMQEILYPLLQGYDSVAMGVDLELGGTDQIFNMLVGRDLVKAYLGKEKLVRAHKLMPAPDALTMSKTMGNGINLSDNAENMYGVAMSYRDEHILTGLELLTDSSDKELVEIKKSMEAGDNPMQYKKLLAARIVTMLKGEQAAQAAEEHFVRTIQQKETAEVRTKISVSKLSDRLSHLGKPNDVITAIAELMSSSKGSAKQLLKQSGVEINGQKLDPEILVYEFKLGDIIKLGKRNWFELVK